LTWQDPSGQTCQLDGLWCVEESKLKSISHEKLQTLHQADALGLAYAQLLSLSNLHGLIATQVAVRSGSRKSLRTKKVAGSRE
jgi:hypothetical protein